MTMEESNEKNLLSEVSSSNEYKVDDIIRDLQDIDPWNVDEFDKDLMDWSDTQFFEQSEFQNRYFVVNSQVTPYRKLRQAIMEIQTRQNALQKCTISYKRCMNDIDRLRFDYENEEDQFRKKDIQYELELLFLDRQVWLNKLKQCKHEIAGMIKIIKEINPNFADVKDKISNHELLEEEEHKYWIARMAKQSALDLLTTGRIQAGNLDSMLMMSPEDQAAVTDLALTYSTAMNHSIGGIKTLAEEKVERMLEGKPPQMFDCGGVLTDYATNNITDRLIQSSDQSETQS